MRSLRRNPRSLGRGGCQKQLDQPAEPLGFIRVNVHNYVDVSLQVGSDVANLPYRINGFPRDWISLALQRLNLIDESRLHLSPLGLKNFLATVGFGKSALRLAGR
jgi:hypothetical protein